MKEIEQIYCNDFGMSFYWKAQKPILNDKVQLVFKETGFYFSVAELQNFVCLIDDSALKNSCCHDCEIKNHCAKFLLKTPCVQIDLAVTMKELDAIKDLVHGTLFKINLEDYVFGPGRN